MRCSKTLIVVGLGGSLAENSKSRAALQVALDGAADAGAETQLLDLRRLDLPLYNPEDDEPTETAASLIEAAYAANGLLWSSPLYQGTISGAFKNALDWLHTLGAREPPHLHDKVIGLNQRDLLPVERAVGMAPFMELYRSRARAVAIAHDAMRTRAQGGPSIEIHFPLRPFAMRQWRRWWCCRCRRCWCCRCRSPR